MALVRTPFPLALVDFFDFLLCEVDLLSGARGRLEVLVSIGIRLRHSDHTSIHTMIRMNTATTILIHTRSTVNHGFSVPLFTGDDDDADVIGGGNEVSMLITSRVFYILSILTSILFTKQTSKLLDF